MEEKRKRISVIVQDPDHGLFYQRLHLLLRHLDPKKYEINCYSYHDFPMWKAYYTDVFVLAHPSDPMAFEFARRIKIQFKKPLVVDIDDLLSHLPKDHPDYLEMKPFLDNVPRILQIANHVVYSTDYLMKSYAHLNRNFSVIPNSINEDLFKGYQVKEKPYKKGFIVGWSGGRTHIADQMYSFLPGLIRFMEEFEDVRCHFKFLCPQILLDKFGSRVVFDETLTHFMDYHAYLSTVPWDVALVGLYNHPFNDAKSDLKLIEFSPHEIPIIASPRADFIQHKDRNIMLYADDDEQWYTALKHAYLEKEHMKDMAKRARKFVMEERNSKVVSQKWDQLLSRL